MVLFFNFLPSGSYLYTLCYFVLVVGGYIAAANCGPCLLPEEWCVTYIDLCSVATGDFNYLTVGLRE